MIISNSSPTENCAESIFSFLKNNASQPTLLFWSGGSASKIAELLVPKLNNFDDLSWLTMSLIDERYGQPGHADSNETLIRTNGLIDLVEKKSGQWFPVLTGLPIEQEIDRMNSFFTSNYTQPTKKLGLFGIGEDGHTAGMLPVFDDSTPFDSLFSPATNEVYSFFNLNQVNPNYPNPFKERMTLNMNGIKNLDERVVFASGEKKKSVLKKINQSSTSIHLCPAKIFSEVPSHLFTDQNLS